MKLRFTVRHKGEHAPAFCNPAWLRKLDRIVRSNFRSQHDASCRTRSETHRPVNTCSSGMHPRICVPIYTHAFYSCMQRAYTNNQPRSWFYCSYLQRRLLAAIDRCFAAGKQPVPAPRRLVRTVPSFVQSATGSLSSLLASLIVCSSFKYHRCQKRYICYWPAVSYNALTQL